MGSGNWADLNYNGRHVDILNPLTITTALAGTYPGLGGSAGTSGLQGIKHLLIQAKFVYGSGGTSADAYLQTSLDNGATWFDVANFHFTTATATKISSLRAMVAPASQAFAPSDAALTANTVIDGVLGDRFRLKVVTVGTYAGGTTLEVDLHLKG